MLAGDLEGTRDWAGRALRLLDTMPGGHGSRTCGCTRSTTSAPSSSRAATPCSGLRLLQESLDRAVAADLHEHAARAFTNLGALAVRQHRHADARRHPRRPASTTASSGTSTPGTTTCGAGRHQPALRGPARGGDRPGRAGAAQPPRRRGQPDRPAVRDRPGAGVDGTGGVAAAARRGAGARHRYGRGPTRLGRRRGGVRDRVDRPTTRTWCARHLGVGARPARRLGLDARPGRDLAAPGLEAGSWSRSRRRTSPS